MNCLEFRKVVASESTGDATEVAAHARDCPLCAKYSADMLSLNLQLERALRVPAPERLPSEYIGDPQQTSSPKPAAAQRKWYALAASLVAALGIAIGWRALVSPDSLSSAVVAHVYHEPNLLVLPEDTRVDRSQFAKVLRSSHVSLNDDIGEVAHAGLCLFRGNLVAHLVVTTGSGAVTVLLLPDEHLGEATPINEEGFVGTIVPAGKGSIAVIGQDADAAKSVENRIVHAVDWSA